MENESSNLPVDPVSDVAGPVEVKEAVKQELSPKEKLDNLLKLQKEEGLSVKQETEKRKLQKGLKMFKRQRNQFQKMLNKWRSQDSKRQGTLLNATAAARREIGEKNFAMLKDLYTINVPEQKDETGNVTQQAQTVVNYPGLVRESKHVVAMERESRILAGKRSRRSGSSNTRRVHKSTMDFLLKRTAEETVRQAQEKAE